MISVIVSLHTLLVWKWKEVLSKLSRVGVGEFKTYSLYLQRCQPLEISNLETFSFALPPFPLNINDQPPPSPVPDPPDKHNSIQSLFIMWEWLRALYEVSHEVQTITIRCYDNLCQ